MKLVAIITVLLSFAFSGQAQAYLFVDNFNGPSFGAEWSANNASIVSGQAVVLQPNNTGGYGLTFTLPSSISGIFETSVEFDFLNYTSLTYGNGERIGLAVNSKAFVERVSDHRFGGEVYLTDFQAFGAGIHPNPGIVTPYFSGTLHLSRDASNTISAYYSDAGSSGKSLVWSYSNIADDITSVNLSIWNDPSFSIGNGPLMVAFDNFTFATPGTPDPTATPEPASMLLMGVGVAGMAFMKRRRKMKNAN